MIFESLFGSGSNSIDRETWDDIIDMLIAHLEKIRNDWIEISQKLLWEEYLKDYPDVDEINPNDEIKKHIKAIQGAHAILAYGKKEYIPPGSEGQDFTEQFVKNYTTSESNLDGSADEVEELIYGYLEGNDPEMEIGTFSFSANITTMFVGKELKDPQLAMYMQNLIGQLIKLTEESTELIFERVEEDDKEHIVELLDEKRENHPWERFFKDGFSF